MSGTVRLERRAGAAWITLDRPDKLNALDAAMVAALDARLDEAAADDEVRVVVVRGAGRAFSAGYDLTDGPSGPRSADDWHAELERDVELTLSCGRCPSRRSPPSTAGASAVRSISRSPATWSSRPTTPASASRRSRSARARSRCCSRS